jgi:hypothetical protein
MPKSPLDPDVADAARTVPALTAYERRTYRYLSAASENADAEGAKSLASCCTLISSASLTAHGNRSKATWPAQNGCRDTATSFGCAAPPSPSPANNSFPERTSS